MRPVEIVLVAGEASGDLHAAHLVQAIHATYPNQYQISAVGGKQLAALQVNMIDDLAQYGVTGFTEVIKHARLIRKSFNKITAYLKEAKPALVILVDYPGFNLRLAKHIKTKLNLSILYYISPQIWAWKANRVHAIKKYVDHMAVILPFEKGLYAKAKIPCTFVGHPLLETLLSSDKLTAKASLNLPPHSKLIALLPGSRFNELKYHLPVLMGAVKSLLKHDPHLQFVIPIASSLSESDFSILKNDPTLPIHLTHSQAQIAINASDMVVVASGTASLECALLAKPMCIIYKASVLTSMIVNKVIKIKYGGLCNLIANKMIVPELLQEDCTAETITEIVMAYLTQPALAQTMIKQLKEVKNQLLCQASDQSLTHLVNQLIINSSATNHPDPKMT